MSLILYPFAQVLDLGEAAAAQQAMSAEEVAALRTQLAAAEASAAQAAQQLAVAQDQNEGLRQELAEARSAGTPKGEGAKKVLPMSFARIRVRRGSYPSAGGRGGELYQAAACRHRSVLPG